MSKNLRSFTQAIYAFDAVVQRVPADKWDAATPCEEWNAKELVEHQCSVLNGVATMARTGEMAAPTPSPESDDVVGTWNACRDNVLTSLDQPNTLSQEGPFWFKAADIDGVCGMVQWDPVTHAWDLATAAGVDHGLSDQLLADTLDSVLSRQEMFVKSGRTKEGPEVAADAPLLDRYLAAVGRAA